jgi:hypothetical protein
MPTHLLWLPVMVCMQLLLACWGGLMLGPLPGSPGAFPAAGAGTREAGGSSGNDGSRERVNG